MAPDFQERYDTARPSWIRTNDKRFADLPAGSTILIPSPQDIEAEVADLGPDDTLTMTALRRALAGRHGAEGCCPVMTGRHLRVVAELVLDALDAGTPADEVVPIWKAIEARNKLAPRFEGRV